MFEMDVKGLQGVIKYAGALPGNMGDASKIALQRAANYWLSQHKMRWIKRVSPEGKEWKPNNPLWAEIKGQSTPLTGITQGTTRTWRGIKFVGNTVHMRSALQKKDAGDKIIFSYPPSVKDRAKATHYGRSGSVLQAGKFSITFNIPARPHTGLGPGDLEEINKIFGRATTEGLMK